MITTRMTGPEVTREYMADYVDVLRPRFLGILSRRFHDLKVSKGKWVSLRRNWEIKTPRGNKYLVVSLRGRHTKSTGQGFSSVVALETLDSGTGRKVAYIFSDTFPILLTSGFLRETGMGLSEFLGHGCAWDIKSDKSKEGERYSAYIPLGSCRAGVGGWKDGVLILRHVTEFKEGENPVDVFLASRAPKKLSDIDQAWEDYYRLESPQTLIYDKININQWETT